MMVVISVNRSLKQDKRKQNKRQGEKNEEEGRGESGERKWQNTK